MGEARYDGLAEWFDREFATGPRAAGPRAALTRLLGAGEGRLLDVGCGTGSFSAALAELGWRVTGVDISEDQLRLARERGVEVVRADAADLPFDDLSFDAAVSTWTHTDVDDLGAVLAEVARVLRPRAPFVYIGAHPCFVGPHSRFVGAVGVPELHPGYRSTRRYFEGPAISAEGLRARVGATHLPLSSFLQAFLDAGFALERIEEDERGEYPHVLALRFRR
ncbi:MAG: methyltransferase domain-containing protein [Thermoleophilia bacterium]|nr:methyltransferase domain-containing protein [Thermoleophilia bacterium]